MSQTDFDPAIVAPLLEAIKKAFSVQASTNIKILSFKPIHMVEPMNLEIASMMGLLSKKVNGTLAVLFPGPTFLGLINKMLGESYTEINDENADAAGEFLNIIYGIARPIINDAGHDFAPAIPSVVRGKTIQISHAAGYLVGAITCQSEFGDFRLELSLKKVA